MPGNKIVKKTVSLHGSKIHSLKIYNAMKLRVLFSLIAMFGIWSIQAQIETVGIIGTATPGGWDADTDMDQDPDNPDLWTLQIQLTDGEAKFRANDDWAINWGNTDFPIGVGLANGPNIPVPAGLTNITFNSATGEYYFSVVSDIGIIGSATPFGWDEDVNMYQDENDPDQYFLPVSLSAGEAKFRQDDSWDINWGAEDFPSGVGVQNGPNIPIPVGGEYIVHFNKATGAYNFVLTSFSTVGIIGSATPGGDEPTALNPGGGPGEWTLNVDLADGELLFSGDNGVAIWGGTDFPSGTATLDGDPLAITAGVYQVNFNSKTLEYSFVPIVYYDAVGIIGSATPGGWDEDTDMTVDPLDPFQWSLRIVLQDGEAKFRADDDWAVNWGDGTFPTGTALLDGPNIPVTAGEYNISFNTFTGFYRFQELLIYSSVGLIGTGTEFGDWATDVEMTKDDDDENLWKLASVTLQNGECKFRAENDWAVNWGSTAWPSGVGTQDGPNIPITGGTYGVTLNSATGEYAFGDPLSSTRDLLNPSSIKAFPNPAQDVLYLDLSAVELQGMITLSVFDASGKLVYTERHAPNTQLALGVHALQNGYYTLHISNSQYIIGKKFVVARG